MPNEVAQVNPNELASRAEDMIDKVIARSNDPMSILMLSELKTVVRRMGRQNQLRATEIQRLNAIIELEAATREQIISAEVQERMVREIIHD